MSGVRYMIPCGSIYLVRGMFSRVPYHQYIHSKGVYPPERMEMPGNVANHELRQKWFIITSEEIGRIRESAL